MFKKFEDAVEKIGDAEFHIHEPGCTEADDIIQFLQVGVVKQIKSGLIDQLQNTRFITVKPRILPGKEIVLLENGTFIE